MMTAARTANEIGKAPGRGRPIVPRKEAEALLGNLAHRRVRLTERVVVTSSPTACPACGSPRVMWGCDPEQTRDRDVIHPLVWHETERMADSFICRDCEAGWIEPDNPVEITWVRPYWRMTGGGPDAEEV